MSKQFQLYVLPSDADALVKEIQGRFGVRILSENSPSSEPTELLSPVREGSMKFRTGEQTSIRCYLAPVFGRIKVNYYQKPNHWVIQPESEAIQFSGCDFDGKTLLIGRMYFQTVDIQEGEIVKKSEEFLEWANDVFRFSKRALNRDPALGPLGAYVGKDATIFRQKGGKLASSIKATREQVYE